MLSLIRKVTATINNSDVCHNLLYIEFLPLKLQNRNSNKFTPRNQVTLYMISRANVVSVSVAVKIH